MRSDALQRFEGMLGIIRDRVRGVARRHHVGCYITGRAGTGKTFTIKHTLEEEKCHVKPLNARATPMGLYGVAKSYPESIIFVDDINHLWKQQGAQQIILSLAEGEADKPRIVTYTQKNKQEEFEFSGGLIGASNLPLGHDPVANAIASRVQTFSFEPTDDMIHAFMRHLAKKGYKDMKPKECEEVIDFVIQWGNASQRRIDLRHMNKSWEDYRLHKANGTETHWQDLIRSSLAHIRVDDEVMERRVDRQEDKRRIARDVMSKFKNDRTKRDAEWERQTGLSARMLYRYAEDV